MLPGMATANNADSGTVNPEGCRSFGVRKIHASKPSNILLGQLGAAHLDASWLPVSFHPVGNIVAIRSDANMLGLHTNWPIAGMKDMHALGDGADVNAVCRNVSGNMLAAQTESTVPVGIGVPRPVPATVSRGRSRHVSGERLCLGDASPSQARASGWVTVAAVSFVMRVAQSLGFSRVCATIYRALHLSKFTLGMPCRNPL